jgi:SHS2 domain-containing protein
MVEFVERTRTRRNAERPDRFLSEQPTWEHPGRMTMLFAPKPSFKCLPREHEVCIQLRAGTIGEILQQAALALGDTLLPEGPSPGPEELHEIILDASDRTSLLIAWLDELLFLAEHNRWVPSRIEIKQATETHLHASGWGHVLSPAPSPDRRTIWQGCRFEVREGGYEVEFHLRR